MVKKHTHTHTEQRNVMKHVHATFHPKIKKKDIHERNYIVHNKQETYFTL